MFKSNSCCTLTVFLGNHLCWADFLGGSDGKGAACNAGDLGSVLRLGRSPGGGNGYSLQYSCLENPMERSLVSSSPWGLKELDTTEGLTCFHTS